MDATNRDAWLARVADAANWIGDDVGTQVGLSEMTAGLGASGALQVLRDDVARAEARLKRLENRD